MRRIPVERESLTVAKGKQNVIKFIKNRFF